VFDLLDQVEANLSLTKVGIIEFAESDAYCGKRLYPGQRVLLKLIFLEPLEPWEDEILDHWIAGGDNGNEFEISPNIRERAQWLRDNGYDHFPEIDLVGGRRSSKGFVTGIAMAKIMWDTLQLQDPGTHYGIDPEKNIEFSCVAGSEQQAKERQYADLSSTVETCKSFEPYIVNSLETEIRVATGADLQRRARTKRQGNRKIAKDIARLRGKAYAANAGTIRGSATMAVCIDEMAWMLAGETKSSAEQVYDAITPSLGQFRKDGIIFCNSSPYSKVGRFYERVQQAMRPFNPDFDPAEVIDQERNIVNGDPLLFAFRFPSWGLFKHYDKDPEKRFHKALMVSPDWTKEHHPYLSAEDLQTVTKERAVEAANPETYRVEYRSHFAEVTDSYLNPLMVDRAFMGVPTGFDPEGKVVLTPLRTNWGEGATNLYKYKFHLDPSSTTAGFGFAIAHLERIEDKAGNLAPHAVFDIVKRWNPKDFPGQTIQWPVVIKDILLYADIFRPYEITMDQFQSAEPIQTLQYSLMERGIEGINVYVRTATLEENWFRWETFKTALNHGLVHAPNDTEDTALASDELKFLQQKNTGGRYPRVDKQDIGPVQTKDMADCIAECTQALIGNLIANEMRDRAVSAVMAPGAQGGFQIGGRQGPTLSELHPNLAGYYGGSRAGEQNLPAVQAVVPRRMALGGMSGHGRRGMNRMGGRRGR
jgi:hypothetical protein